MDNHLTNLAGVMLNLGAGAGKISEAEVLIQRECDVGVELGDQVILEHCDWINTDHVTRILASDWTILSPEASR